MISEHVAEIRTNSKGKEGSAEHRALKMTTSEPVSMHGAVCASKSLLKKVWYQNTLIPAMFEALFMVG
jgi:hypothetical protein